MLAPKDWPLATPIETARLALEPLRAAHADELAPLLDDPALHEFIGGGPATLEELRARYARQAGGRSPDGSQGWLNWIVRHRDSGTAVGTVQATLHREAGLTVADLAWVIAGPHQRRGYAFEAAEGMAAWLRRLGVDQLAANIHPRHEASSRVARRLGLRATGEVIGGELRWVA